MDKVLHILGDCDEKAFKIGRLRERSGNDDAVDIVGAQTSWCMNPSLGVSLPMPCVLSSMNDDRVASRKSLCVLVGPDEPTSLQSLISDAR